MKVRPITGAAPSVEKNSGRYARDRLAFGGAGFADNGCAERIEGQPGKGGNVAAAFVIVGDGGTVAIHAGFGVRIENGDEPAGVGKGQRA